MLEPPLRQAVKDAFGRRVEIVDMSGRVDFDDRFGIELREGGEPGQELLSLGLCRVPDEPAEAGRPVVRAGDRRDIHPAGEDWAASRPEVDLPVLQPSGSLQAAEPLEEGLPVGPVDIKDQRLFEQGPGLGAEQRPGPLVRFDDDPLSVGHEISVGGKIEKLEIALPPFFCGQAGRGQLFGLLVQLLPCHLELFEGRLELFQGLGEQRLVPGGQAGGPLGEPLDELGRPLDPAVEDVRFPQ